MSKQTSGDRELTVGQVFFGSFSGRHQYEILHATPDVTGDELRWIEHYSSLGGSAQIAEDYTPILSFYRLATQDERWAFTRTILRRESYSRGNDFWTQALIVSVQDLEAFRWDIFLLEELFTDVKPGRDARIEVQRIDKADICEQSRRSYRTAMSGYPIPEFTPTALHFLTRGALLLPVKSLPYGMELCRSVFNALPPADRKNLAFCTRFSYDQPMDFQLAAFTPEDQGIVYRHLVKSRRDNRKVFEITPDEDHVVDESIKTWWEIIHEPDAEPISGLSLLDGPDRALRYARMLKDWAHFEMQRSPTQGIEYRFCDQESKDELVKLAQHDANRRLQLIGVVFHTSVVLNFHKMIRTILHNPASRFEDILEACATLRNQEVALESASTLLTVAHRGLAIESDSCTLTSSVLLALEIAHSVDSEPYLVSETPSSFFSSFEQLAQWMVAFYQLRPLFSSALYARLFRYWRKKFGREALNVIIKALKLIFAPDNHLQETKFFPPILAALEEAGPGDEEADRALWYLGLIRDVRATLPTLFTVKIASRIIIEYSLLQFLTQDEWNIYAQPLFETYPEVLLQRSAWTIAECVGSSRSLLKAGAEVFYRVGLQKTPALRETRAAHWELAVRLGTYSVNKGNDSPAISSDYSLLWLLYSVALLTSKNQKPPEVSDGLIASLVPAIEQAVLKPQKETYNLMLRILYLTKATIGLPIWITKQTLGELAKLVLSTPKPSRTRTDITRIMMAVRLEFLFRTYKLQSPSVNRSIGELG